jgi:uncharacterized membrane protein
MGVFNGAMVATAVFVINVWVGLWMGFSVLLGAINIACLVGVSTWQLLKKNKKRMRTSNLYLSIKQSKSLKF